MKKPNPKSLAKNTMVKMKTGVSEGAQLDSFQNGTLQGLGSKLTVTIQTFVDFPQGVALKQKDAAEELRKLLDAANAATNGRLRFDVQLGPSESSEL
jgi:hypothetical protein